MAEPLAPHTSECGGPTFRLPAGAYPLTVHLIDRAEVQVASSVIAPEIPAEIPADRPVTFHLCFSLAPPGLNVGWVKVEPTQGEPFTLESTLIRLDQRLRSEFVWFLLLVTLIVAIRFSGWVPPWPLSLVLSISLALALMRVLGLFGRRQAIRRGVLEAWHFDSDQAIS